MLSQGQAQYFRFTQTILKVLLSYTLITTLTTLAIKKPLNTAKTTAKAAEIVVQCRTDNGNGDIGYINYPNDGIISVKFHTVLPMVFVTMGWTFGIGRLFHSMY